MKPLRLGTTRGYFGLDVGTGAVEEVLGHPKPQTLYPKVLNS